MPSAVVQGILFLSSYAPLLVIFALLDSWGKGLPSIVCIALALTSAIAMWLFFQTASRVKAPMTITLERSKHRDSDAIAYVVTYLVPFVGFEGIGVRPRLALLVLLTVIGALYLRSHMFYVNPLLSLAGYRLFEAEAAEGRVLIIISKRRYIPPGTSLTLSGMSDHVFIERGT